MNVVYTRMDRSAPVVLVCHDSMLGPWLKIASDQLREAGCRVVDMHATIDLKADRGGVEWITALPTADAVIVTNRVALRAEELRVGNRLRGVVYPTIGTDSIDLEVATDLGIPVAHGPTPQNFLSMAESTVMLILALLYDLQGTKDALRLNLPRPTRFRATMLAGKTIGLIGYGRIAMAVAQRLGAWGTRLLAYSPRANSDSVGSDHQVEFVELETLLEESDIVSVHTTLTPATWHLLDARRLAQMKQSAFLVNTSRGAIVDEAALYCALSTGKLAGAALDTFEQEPLPSDSPLRTLGNAILTPHMVGHTQEIFDAIPKVVFENTMRLLCGEEPLYLRNPQVQPAWRRRLATLSS